MRPAMLTVVLSVCVVALPEGQQGRSTAFVGATLIDGTGRDAVPDAVVVLDGARIAAAGPRSSTAIPPGADVVDVKGRYLLPGLVDTNVHLSLYGGISERYETLVRVQPRINPRRLRENRLDARMRASDHDGKAPGCADGERDLVHLERARLLRLGRQNIREG